MAALQITRSSVLLLTGADTMYHSGNYGLEQSDRNKEAGRTQSVSGPALSFIILQ